MTRASLLITIFSLSLPAYAQYSGGTGEPNDPYQIGTSEDLILLGETPEDYDKHFILTADIDLNPNLPGRDIFDKAVIAPDTNDTDLGFQGSLFAGVFDGNGHTISHLTIGGESYLGLFGQLDSGAMISNLGLSAVDINGTGGSIGGLVGRNGGNIETSYSTGTVKGKSGVGGLVGNGFIIRRGSSGRGFPVNGRISNSYSTGTVSGNSNVGGLVGFNGTAHINTSYSASLVSGIEYIGGLVGSGEPLDVQNSVWDVETSGLSESAGGIGLSTTEMMDSYLLGLNGFSNDPNWILDSGQDYSRLAWESTAGDIITEPEIDWLEGHGTEQHPYSIDTVDQFIFLIRKTSILWDKHFVLRTDIDLDANLPNVPVFTQAPIPVFSGIFDGDGHTISNLMIEGESFLGIFGQLSPGAKVKDLGVVDVNITGSGSSSIGGLAGESFNASIIHCYSSGVISGRSTGVGGLVGANTEGSIGTSYSTSSVNGGDRVGGLVGDNSGSINASYSTGTVTGYSDAGGLVGKNKGGDLGNGSIITCYSTGNVTVTGTGDAGGLVGENSGSITASYSTGSITGTNDVGGLVGMNNGGSIVMSYSTGSVSGTGNRLGGFVGRNIYNGIITSSIWDRWTSRQTKSAGGIGLTTIEMQNIDTFLNEGWDFVDETVNGTCDYWQMSDSGYPKLFYHPGNSPMMPQGLGTAKQPYLIRDSRDLGTVWFRSKSHYHLEASIDLSGITWSMAVVPWFGGTFDGKDHVIRYLHIKEGGKCLGLFGQLGPGAELSNLGLEEIDVNGIGDRVGGLVGRNGIWKGGGGILTKCYTSGTVTGGEPYWPSALGAVGGLVGKNYGSVISCTSTVNVNGDSPVGGLVGINHGSVIKSYSRGSVTGANKVGGLVGWNYGKGISIDGSIISGGSIIMSYSTGSVSCSGDYDVGGLVGMNYSGSITSSYSTGTVSGNNRVGGLVGSIGRDFGPTPTISRSYSIGPVKGTGWGVGGLVGDTFASSEVIKSFWDVETSGLLASEGGTGKTTSEMQTATTFLEVGWDFVDETANGTDDIWWILEGQDYPRLSWEAE